MYPHGESTDGSNTMPSFHFAKQLQPGFSCLLSSGSDSVRYSKFLCYVSGSSSRIAQCSTSPALLPWRKPVEANHLVSLGCFFVVDSLSLILVGHSKGKTHETMKRKQVHHTSTSNDFHAALFVDEYQRPSIDVCTIGNSPTLHTNLSNPHLSVQLWVSKLSKRCQHFLNLLVKEKNNFDKWKSCLPACLCMGRYLCLEPVLPVAMRFHASCSAVTSALASPIERLPRAR